MEKPAYLSITEELQNTRLKQTIDRLGPNAKLTIDMLPAQQQRNLYVERLGAAMFPKSGLETLGAPPPGTQARLVPSFTMGTGGYYKSLANTRKIDVDSGGGVKKIIFG